MTSKHTPGPWTQTPGTLNIRADRVGKNGIVMRTPTIASAKCGKWDRFGSHPIAIDRDEALANARLIAAAPEMAALLHAMADKIGDSYKHSGIPKYFRQEAEALLARIEGE